MSKGSILMVVSNYRRFGGHETVIDSLCNGLQNIGYNMAIGAFSFDQDPPDNIEKVRLKKFRSLESGSNNISKCSFDIVHSHHTQMNYHSLLTSKPFIFHYHGASDIIQKINLMTSTLICRNRISRIISVSNAAFNHLIDIVGKRICSKIPSNRVHNGIDTTYYHVGLPTPYKKGDPQLLFVGNLYRHKNVIRLIEIMSDIIRSYPNAYLQIVGNGHDYQILDKEIKRKKLENKIELVGRVSDEDIRLRYSSCDIYISASKWEMFGLPLLEAMACGRPVLLSDIPSHREILEASNAGRLFSLSDDATKICSMLKDVCDNRGSFGSAARRFVENHDWSVVCDRMAGIYSQILV
jgi:glycosyltransferase involved in cell wall biosynthesis